MPWAPSGNLACRRADLLAVGGFDPGFKSYEAADLLLRMTERFGGRIFYVPTAVVMHHHRSTWLEFWKQQLSYGGGYAQFLLRYANRWPWSAGRELAEWKRIGHFAARACVTHGDANLVQRGLFVKFLAQRIGFVSEYFLSRRPAPRPIALERRPA
jgi:cellulose synthase/poly-beta-1,6-N-acetylglucosamine synthase-like glycosyltransferase